MALNFLNKQIHRDDFKLRLLLTNGCNNNCSFCLNDFQAKPKKNPTFLNIDTIYKIIAQYHLSSKQFEFKPKVYLSGGEPTLHPQLYRIIPYLKGLNIPTVLNTNGLFNDRHLDYVITNNDVEVHMGVYRQSEAILKRAITLNAKCIQFVLTNPNSYITASLIGDYLHAGFHVKIFSDFHETDMSEYYNQFANWLFSEFPSYTDKLHFQYTSKQINRGYGCRTIGCNKSCVTLKGLWVFSNGCMAPCPQVNEKGVIPNTTNEYSSVVENAYNFHNTNNKEL